MVRGRPRRHGARIRQGGQFDAAIAKHLEALRRQPGLLAARFNLGLAYEQRGDLDLAAQQYREAVRRAPRKAAFRAALAHVLATQGQLAAAMEESTEALRLNPDSAEARFVLGRVLASRGLPDHAIAELERALASKPAFAPAQSMLAALLLERGRVDEAIEHLREVVPSGTLLGRSTGRAWRPRSPDTDGSTTRSRNTRKPSASRRATRACATRSACASRARAGCGTRSFSSPKACGIRPDSDALQVEPWNGARGERRCAGGRGAFQGGAETQPSQPRRTRGPSGTGQGGRARRCGCSKVSGSSWSCPRTTRRARIRTLTEEVPVEARDLVILVDDGSRDDTVAVARAARLTCILHEQRTAATAATRRPATATALAARRRHRRHAPPRLPVHARG